MDQKELMQSINNYRKENNIFKRSIQERSDKFLSITYDGPPFASGTPHFGHGLTSAMKDTILRYKTMKGYRVNRDRWWDCHGLPVEKAVEKHLGIDGRKDIEKIWIQKFVEECRNYVSNTSDERRTFVDQIGRWADMDNAYYTMDLSFMQSVLRAFQTMYNKNLVYKGFKVQRYCPSCATTLANNEVNEGYKDRQDPAITIKFPLRWDTNNNQRNFDPHTYETTVDGFVEIVDCIIKRDGKIFMNYSVKGQKYLCPGGKVEKWDTLEATVTREISEELGVKVTKITALGSIKEVLRGGLFNLNMFEIEIEGEPKLMEPDKLPQMIWAEIIPSDNKLWFAVKIENTIVDDDFEIMNQFYDLYLYEKKIFEKTHAEAQLSVLAWTTTPWTLPSNMFLAVGKHIHYCIVYDEAAKEYFIIAENLLKQYYKNESEYILINTIQGEAIIGLRYEPLFQYINKSKIDKKYKDQFFKVIAGEFVSTEDGTGIVHVAPGFGLEDFEAVAKILPREEAKKWLFLPINEYGEFTDEVPDWKWTRVYEANKEVIQRLKDEKKLISQKSYNHSYPHCRRCDTPLVSKAVTSRFIKEPELQPITVPHAKEIGFVPESIKNRFVDTLESAPDWNLSRNRYRWAPLPIWENTKNEEDKIVIGNLDELFQWTKTWSANITKHILIRHGETDYNQKGFFDSYSKATLSIKGQKQAKVLGKKLKKEIGKKEKFIIVISPLRRTLETIQPLIDKIFTPDDLKKITTQYAEIQKIYQDLRNNNKLQTYFKDTNTQKLFQITEQFYVDFRITEIIIPELQSQPRIKHLTTSKPTDQKLTPQSECMNEVFARNAEYIKDISIKFPSKTIITVMHKDSVITTIKAFKDFDYLTQKYRYSPDNTQINVRYRDNQRNTEVDLHKPYIDNYWFTKGKKEYRRIPEVMDCRFESGAMPFGQVGYIGEKDSKLIYPADFIIEGLDQTRGRFRTLHVVGNAVMGKNSYNNVVINGMVLAEDGKKMSKKLKNYPDPEYLFNKYGSDAYRFYLLSSPGVKAEPVKFSEKGVEQVYKDFTAAISNAYKFFETYAKIDNFIYNKPTLYFLRHGEAEWENTEAKLTIQAKEYMQTPEFIEQVLRIAPDTIYTSPFVRAQETAEIIQTIIKDHLGKKVKIKIEETLSTNEVIKGYEKIIIKEWGKNILLVSHIPQFEDIWSVYYQDNKWAKISKWEFIKLPTYKISNELDKWILAEIHNLGIELEKEMNAYTLDNGAKLALGFIDKLNNRYIRRSRRRFWASGMNEDKTSAYHTMFEILEQYMKICAPFAPFISEHIYLELQKFKTVNTNISVHLEHLPLPSEKYINKELLSEVETIRRIISLGLFIRSKNKIAVKQPLQKIELKLE